MAVGPAGILPAAPDFNAKQLLGKHNARMLSAPAPTHLEPRVAHPVVVKRLDFRRFTVLRCKLLHSWLLWKLNAKCRRAGTLGNLTISPISVL